MQYQSWHWVPRVAHMLKFYFWQPIFGTRPSTSMQKFRDLSFQTLFSSNRTTLTSIRDLSSLPFFGGEFCYSLEYNFACLIVQRIKFWIVSIQNTLEKVYKAWGVQLLYICKLQACCRTPLPLWVRLWEANLQKRHDLCMTSMWRPSIKFLDQKYLFKNWRKLCEQVLWLLGE